MHFSLRKGKWDPRKAQTESAMYRNCENTYTTKEKIQGKNIFDGGNRSALSCAL